MPPPLPHAQASAAAVAASQALIDEAGRHDATLQTPPVRPCSLMPGAEGLCCRMPCTRSYVRSSLHTQQVFGKECTRSATLMAKHMNGMDLCHQQSIRDKALQ